MHNCERGSISVVTKFGRTDYRNRPVVCAMRDMSNGLSNRDNFQNALRVVEEATRRWLGENRARCSLRSARRFEPYEGAAARLCRKKEVPHFFLVRQHETADLQEVFLCNPRFGQIHAVRPLLDFFFDVACSATSSDHQQDLSDTTFFCRRLGLGRFTEWQSLAQRKYQFAITHCFGHDLERFPVEF
jgi:hypothetical protein